MSGDSTTIAAESDRDAESSRRSVGIALPVGLTPRNTVLGAGGLALLALVVARASGIAYNLPGGAVSIPPALRGAIAAGTAILVGAALVAVAIAAGGGTVRVGLLFAGVFGVLPLLSEAATVSAAVAVVGGGGVAVLGLLEPRLSTRGLRHVVVGTALWTGTALSIAGATGIADGGVRGIGATLTLAGIAGFLAFGRAGVPVILAWFATTAAVALASVAAPFVLGSALLVEFAVVGTPHLLVALAVGGATACVVSGVASGRPELAMGAAIVLLAGVPVTFTAASATLLGLALLSLGDVPGAGVTP